jgi:hypothetical protein
MSCTRKVECRCHAVVAQVGRVVVRVITVVVIVVVFVVIITVVLLVKGGGSPSPALRTYGENSIESSQVFSTCPLDDSDSVIPRVGCEADEVLDLGFEK